MNSAVCSSALQVLTDWFSRHDLFVRRHVVDGDVAVGGVPVELVGQKRGAHRGSPKGRGYGEGEKEDNHRHYWDVRHLGSLGSLGSLGICPFRLLLLHLNPSLGRFFSNESRSQLRPLFREALSVSPVRSKSANRGMKRSMFDGDDATDDGKL